MSYSLGSDACKHAHAFIHTSRPSQAPSPFCKFCAPARPAPGGSWAGCHCKGAWASPGGLLRSGTSCSERGCTQHLRATLCELRCSGASAFVPKNALTIDDSRCISFQHVHGRTPTRSCATPNCRGLHGKRPIGSFESTPSGKAWPADNSSGNGGEPAVPFGCPRR